MNSIPCLKKRRINVISLIIIINIVNNIGTSHFSFPHPRTGSHTHTLTCKHYISHFSINKFLHNIVIFSVFFSFSLLLLLLHLYMDRYKYIVQFRYIFSTHTSNIFYLQKNILLCYTHCIKSTYISHQIVASC